MQTKISQLLADEDFESIELELKNPNIFQILSLERREIRHSNFLAYLLDPCETHGLGSRFLRRFIRSIDASGSQSFDADLFSLDSEVEVRREWRHIDILILTQESVILIENKIDTEDNENQLKRYRQIVKEHFQDKKYHYYVYLTPNRSDPIDNNEASHYINLGYQDISDGLASMLRVFEKSIPEKIKTYVQDYLTSINRELLMSDEINKKAMKVYQKHKEALDFIFSNIQDNSEEKYQIFESYLVGNGYKIGSKNKGWIRFLTPELSNLQAAGILSAEGQTGWQNKEVFLFEINFTKVGKVEIKATVSPGQSPIRDLVVEANKDLPCFRNPKGKKWLVFYVTNKDLDVDALLEKTDEEIKKTLDALFAEVGPKIQDISKRIFNALQQNP